MESLACAALALTLPLTHRICARRNWHGRQAKKEQAGLAQQASRFGKQPAAPSSSHIARSNSGNVYAVNNKLMRKAVRLIRLFPQYSDVVVSVARKVCCPLSCPHSKTHHPRHSVVPFTPVSFLLHMPKCYDDVCNGSSCKGLAPIFSKYESTAFGLSMCLRVPTRQ